MAEFEIIRSYPGSNVSLAIPVVAARGVAMQTDGATPTQAKLAGAGGHFAGFLTRNVTATGPTLADHVYPGRIELDVKQGLECSLEKADAVEAEGPTHVLDSGTGLIDMNTAADTELAFREGKFAVKQNGETAYYKLAAQLTPETVGQVRIRVEAIR
jgi:hypothetical protein